MKLIALAAAGLIAAGTLAATPAEAQYRNGWNGGYDRGWNGDRGWRGWRGDRGWRGNRGWGRSRVRCRWVEGYYGPVRRCFRIYR